MCELNSRMSDGVEVQLMWCRDDDRLWVSVNDARQGESFLIPVAVGERAMDVFHHPFAYAGHHGITPDVAVAQVSAVTPPCHETPQVVHASDAD
jgi:hypothetical protein